MYDRSLLGFAGLLLMASCVPPQTQGSAPKAVAKATPAQAPLRTLPSQPSQTADLGPAPGSFIPPPADDSAYLAATVPAAPFVNAAQNQLDAQRSLDCLTAAVYYEARSEPIDGQRAVAQVVLNRVRNPAFPNSVCGVVYQGSTRNTGCQFTFTCDGSMLLRRDAVAWDRARMVAQAALAGGVYAPVGGATYYHTTAILPWWAPSLARVATIGAHIFYAWPGAAGSSLALTQPYAGSEPLAAAAGANGGVDAMNAGYGFGQQAGVTIHRGQIGLAMMTAPGGPASGSVASSGSVNGVRVHLGSGPSAAPASASDSANDASSVSVHTGTAPAASPATATN